MCVAENDVNALANALQNLLKNKDLRLKLTRNCQKTLLQHNPKTVYDKFVKVIEEV